MFPFFLNFAFDYLLLERSFNFSLVAGKICLLFLVSLDQLCEIRNNKRDCSAEDKVHAKYTFRMEQRSLPNFMHCIPSFLSVFVIIWFGISSLFLGINYDFITGPCPNARMHA